jgi:hypothetical protein
MPLLVSGGREVWRAGIEGGTFPGRYGEQMSRVSVHMNKYSASCMLIDQCCGGSEDTWEMGRTGGCL